MSTRGTSPRTGRPAQVHPWLAPLTEEGRQAHEEVERALMADDNNFVSEATTHLRNAIHRVELYGARVVAHEGKLLVYQRGVQVECIVLAAHPEGVSE